MTFVKYITQTFQFSDLFLMNSVNHTVSKISNIQVVSFLNFIHKGWILYICNKRAMLLTNTLYNGCLVNKKLTIKNVKKV